MFSLKEKKILEEKIKELEEKLKESEKTKLEYLNEWKRARADFINYKNQENEIIKEYLNNEKEKIFLKIILILDEFYLIEKKLPQNLKDDKYVQGILRLKDEIINFLKNEGIKEIETEGKEFNPQFHEAVELVKQEEESDFKNGQILEEIKKGYIFNNKVIRPAKVKVVSKIKKDN